MSFSRDRKPTRRPPEPTPEVAPPGQGLGEENSLLQELLNGFGPERDEGQGAGQRPSWLDGLEEMGPFAGRRVSPNGSKTGRA